ncbi:VOC family protein [bacterium]|nr:VOC family protein [bacterium]
MNLNHIALVCSSEAKADRFFLACLNLEKTASKILPAELSEKVFNRKEELKILYYGNDLLSFEVFISSQKDLVENSLGHVCINVQDRDLFIKTCEKEELEILKIPKGDSLMIFIKDYDGNMYEIKENI